MMEKHKEFRNEIKDQEEQFIRKLDQNILLESDDPSIPPYAYKDANVLVKESRAKGKGHIESNFDKSLLKMLKEVVCFKKLAKDGIPNFPGSIEDLVNLQRESLRVYRENVMLAIRDYNLILDSMSPFEKNLFKEHLDTVNLSKNRGLRILKWSSKGTLDSFVKDCRSKCAAIFTKLMKFKQSKREIEDKCREISQTLKFIVFSSRSVYEISDFEQKQQENRESVVKKLRLIITEIRSILCKTYENFVDKTDPIQKAWFEHVIDVDNLVEEELRKAVRISFQELLKAIVGDEKNKTNPTQIFRVFIVLEGGELEYKLDFNPTTQELQDSLALMLTESIEILSGFRRLESDMLEERTRQIDTLLQQEKEASKVPSMGPKFGRSQNFSFSNDFLSKERTVIPGYKERVLDDVSSLTHEIKKKLKDQCSQLLSQLDPWRNKQLKLFWTNDKERYANYIIEQKLPVSSLRSTIEGYDNNQNEIQVERSSDDSLCIQVYTSKIRSRLVDLIYETQKTLLTKIKDKTLEELSQLHEQFESSERQLRPIPTDLSQLSKALVLWKKLMEDKPEIEARLTPIEEKFKLLDDFMMVFKDDEIKRRQTMRSAYDSFVTMLGEIKIRNESTYTSLQNEHNRKLEDFEKDVRENQDYFTKNAPFNSSDVGSVDKAFNLIQSFTEITQDFRRREDDMKFGFELFKINYVPIPELKHIELGISNLDQIWKKKKDWLTQWDELKQTKFVDV